MPNVLAMVIDDDPDLNEAFSLALEHAGFEVERIRDSRIAVKRVAERLPAVITLDMNMPFVNGVDILHEIRQNPQLDNVKVIVITAAPQTVQDSDHELADIVLFKPVSLSQIMNMAKRLTAQLRESGSAAPNGTKSG